MNNSVLSNHLDLSTAIIRVIVFFDLFDYPLTAWEVRQYSGRSFPLGEFIRVLEEDSRLGQQHGFYFLAGRGGIVGTRQRRYNYSRRKLKIAARFTRVFRFWPFIKLIAVANSIGAFNLRDGSDIDFFIISDSRRVWLSRLFCTGLAKLLNRRPTAKNKRDKICLSFYIAVDRLNLSGLRLPLADPYFDYWLRNLIVLYNKDNIAADFLAANDQGAIYPVRQPTAKNFLDLLEAIVHRWQLNIMPEALKSAVNQSDGVVVDDGIIKLYLVDRRREFLEKYGNKMAEVGTPRV